jgi:hypothetical protein
MRVQNISKISLGIYSWEPQSFARMSGRNDGSLLFFSHLFEVTVQITRKCSLNQFNREVSIHMYYIYYGSFVYPLRRVMISFETHRYCNADKYKLFSRWNQRSNNCGNMSNFSVKKIITTSFVSKTLNINTYNNHFIRTFFMDVSMTFYFERRKQTTGVWKKTFWEVSSVECISHDKEFSDYLY